LPTRDGRRFAGRSPFLWRFIACSSSRTAAVIALEPGGRGHQDRHVGAQSRGLGQSALELVGEKIDVELGHAVVHRLLDPRHQRLAGNLSQARLRSWGLAAVGVRPRRSADRPAISARTPYSAGRPNKANRQGLAWAPVPKWLMDADTRAHGNGGRCRKIRVMSFLS
jgi:hypothetical protein